jgi:hypothetical protein
LLPTSLLLLLLHIHKSHWFQVILNHRSPPTMKRMDIFCASPASTAICSSMEHRSMVRRGPRPIDRRNPHIHGRRKSQPHVPCSSQFPINPKPYYEKYRRSSSTSNQTDLRIKSSADINDLNSPPGSSRYLLSDSPFIDWLSDQSEPAGASALVPAEPAKPRRPSSNDSPALKSSFSARSHDQARFLLISLFVFHASRKNLNLVSYSLLKNKFLECFWTNIYTTLFVVVI